MKTEPPDRAVRCRYKRRDQNMCPNPAADQSPDAWIVLCAHHLARAVQLVNDQMKAADAAVLRRAL